MRRGRIDGTGIEAVPSKGESLNLQDKAIWCVQFALACAAILAASTQLVLVHGIGSTTTNVQPVTTALYLLFFLVMAGYSRIQWRLRPLVGLRTFAVRILALLQATACLLAFFAISSSSPEAHDAMVNYGVINLALLLAYALIATTLIFGDAWLGPVAGFLKFGREFPLEEDARRRDGE